jgi:hypothetical protein
MKIPRTKIIISDSRFFLIGLVFFLFPYFYFSLWSDKPRITGNDFAAFFLFYSFSYYFFIFSLKILVNNYEYIVFFFQNLFSGIYKFKFKEFLIQLNLLVFSILLFPFLIIADNVYSDFRYEELRNVCRSIRPEYKAGDCYKLLDKEYNNERRDINQKLEFIINSTLITLVSFFIILILIRNFFSAKNKKALDWDPYLSDNKNYRLWFFIGKYIVLALFFTAVLIVFQGIIEDFIVFIEKIFNIDRADSVRVSLIYLYGTLVYLFMWFISKFELPQKKN